MTQSLVLITGGAGFIGTHLARHLEAQGSGVRILDAYEQQVHGLAERVPSSHDVVRGDVADAEILDRCLQDVTHVVHLAAAVGVGQSMYEITKYCRTNVLGTAQLLESIVKRGGAVEKLIVASSMSIYGEGLHRCDDCDITRSGERGSQNPGPGDWDPTCFVCGRPLVACPTPEAKPLQPTSVYSINKRDQEEMCLAVGRAYGIPTVALRFFNVYGPGQSLENPYTGVAAIFSSRLLASSPPLVFEDGLQSRDFIHVEDVVRACAEALHASNVKDLALNVGTGRATSVLELSEMLRTVIGGPQANVLNSYRAGDIRHCYADVSAITSVLSWRPRVALADGIEDLVRWVRTQTGDRYGQDRAYGELKSFGLVR